MPRFVVHITGTPGLTFGGWCEVATAEGDVTTQHLAGTVPTQFALAGTRLACAVQNQSGTGTLRVHVFQDTRLVSTSETTGGGTIVVHLALP